MNTTDCFGDVIKAHTVIDTLAEGRIVTIHKTEEGRFIVTEACDDYYSISLSKEQLIKLGNELIELANSRE